MIRTIAVFALLTLTACAPAPATTLPPTLTPLPPPTAKLEPLPTLMLMPTSTPARAVPNFEHIVFIIFENREFGSVIGSNSAPYFNILAETNTLLTEYYSLRHPSLPNYIGLIGGDTFGITSDCSDCFINAKSLPDLIEASGRTWKTYQEDMPSPCYVGDTQVYVQKHNPYIYFDPIRLDPERCKRSIVPLTELDADISSRSLPNFIHITPNLCYSAHSCALEMADPWLDTLLDRLVPALEADGKPYLIVVTWEEGQTGKGCCGLQEPAGGRVATILISPRARENFRDDTPYTHYSLLKTVSEAWGLPLLGHAADAGTSLIERPWK